MSHDRVMLEFCDYVEARCRRKDPAMRVELKRLPHRSPWIYAVVLIARNGVQEAYEVDASTAEWIKMYG